MTYVSTNHFDRTISVPVCLPQTELRRGKTLQVATWTLERGQKLLLRSLTLSVVRILNPGALPIYANTALGTASVGLYLEGAVTSPIALGRCTTVGTSTANPFTAHKAITPGRYTVVVSNNTTNLDLAVCVTGGFRVYT